MTKKKKQKQPCIGIRSIIERLQEAKDCDTLCHVGRNRLTWWKRNALKFPTVKAALQTWTVDQIEAWFSWADIYFGGGLEEDWEYAISSMEDVAITAEQKECMKAFLKLRPTMKEILLDKSERELAGRGSL